ncbi:MAG: RNA polymerase sigma factor [Sphingomonas sp.]
MPPADQNKRTVLLAISGDIGAFETMVRSHQSYVLRLLRRSCGDAALAEDLAQATFLKAWQQLASLRDAAALRGWLRRIALNNLVDAARRGTIATDALTENIEAAQSSGRKDDPLERMDMDRALDGLAYAPRTCIVLAYGEGMSHAEIADALDMPIGTVKSHIARGLARLRIALEPGTESDG